MPDQVPAMIVATAILFLCVLTYLMVATTSPRALGYCSRRQVRRAQVIIGFLYGLVVLASPLPALLTPSSPLWWLAVPATVLVVIISGRRARATFKAQLFVTADTSDYTISEVLHCLVSYVPRYAPDSQWLEVEANGTEIKVTTCQIFDEDMPKSRLLQLEDVESVQRFFQVVIRQLDQFSIPGYRPKQEEYHSLRMYCENGVWAINAS